MQRSWPARALPAAMSVLMTMQSYASNVYAVASLRCSWNMTTLPPIIARCKFSCKAAEVLDAQPWPPHQRHGRHGSRLERGSCTTAETTCAVHRCART